MRKIDSEKLVCTAQQAEQLVALGILPASSFCYEWEDKCEQISETIGALQLSAGWVFAGEFMLQDKVLPAFTMEELCILIGGDFPKPEIPGMHEWKRGANMLIYNLYLPKKMQQFPTGAQAAAAMLEHLLTTKKLKPEDCNARMDAFITGEKYNPLDEQLKKEQKK